MVPLPDRELKTPPMCGICGFEKKRLKKTTKRKYLPVYVCLTGKAGRNPCDGDLKYAVFSA